MKPSPPWFAVTEEVPHERSRVSEGNYSNVEEELSSNFQIPRVGAQQPKLYNPRVNYIVVYIRILVYIYESLFLYTNLVVYTRILMYIYES